MFYRKANEGFWWLSALENPALLLRPPLLLIKMFGGRAGGCESWSAYNKLGEMQLREWSILNLVCKYCMFPRYNYPFRNCRQPHWAFLGIFGPQVLSKAFKVHSKQSNGHDITEESWWDHSKDHVIPSNYPTCLRSPSTRLLDSS